MSWVHCNKCFEEPDATKSTRKFFLTSCSHISCLQCQESLRNQCPTCEREGIKSIPIDSSMNKQYRMFFMDVAGIITTKLDEMGRIRRFQDSQIQNLVKGTLKFQDVVRNYQATLKKYEEEHKRINKENQDLHFALQKASSSASYTSTLSSASSDRQKSRSSAPLLESNQRPDLRATLNAADRQRTYSRSSNTASRLDGPALSSASIDEQRSRSFNTAPTYESNPRGTLNSTDQKRTYSRSSNTASRLDGNPQLRAAVNASTDRQRSRTFLSNPRPDLRATLNNVADQQRIYSRSSNAAPRLDGNNIPRPEFRATFSAKNDQQQRTRSKSPNNDIYMQGTLKKGSILPVSNY
uniref:RING-type domain-containing protein n=1 Tax=Panagrolaimus davidi TaxID=227884 RepID=A0A914PLC0_9BILA